jgi:acyl-CoA reductase-like NAD-dependent aldehyde dehydrogenase
MGAADMIEWYAEEARRTYGQVIPARSGGALQFIGRAAHEARALELGGHGPVIIAADADVDR